MMLPTIIEVKRLAGGDDAYEVVVEWPEGPRRYAVTVSESGGIRMLHAEALELELARCPALTKRVIPLVFALHDGKDVSLPVIVD